MQSENQEQIRDTSSSKSKTLSLSLLHKAQVGVSPPLSAKGMMDEIRDDGLNKVQEISPKRYRYFLAMSLGLF